MELLIYKASAGSGKTFRLAVDFIKHLVKNPRAYREILAVTFTNKATAEMKERILGQLNGIRLAHPNAESYLNVLKHELKNCNHHTVLNDEEIRLQAENALLLMLHDYNHFRVETIDSFFQSVMRNLAHELQLQPNLNIELNNHEILDKAVDSLIEKLSPDSVVMHWLLEYIDERIKQDKRWNVSNELKDFGRNIFNESYVEQGVELRKTLRNPHSIKQFKDILKELETDALERMKAFNDQFEGELELNALSVADLKNGSRGIASYFQKLNNGHISDKDILNKTLSACMEDSKNWVTKSSTRHNEIISLVENSLMPLLIDAEKYRQDALYTINSCRMAGQHLNQLQLLNHIDEEVRTLCKEQNRFILSDTITLLHNMVSEVDSPFIFEKLGAQLRTLMMDEFQDTSRMQWQNFRILLVEGLSQGADSLIVGDVKQSIYRWRNGDWGILNGLGKEKTNSLIDNFPIRTESLQINYRSETYITDFNNALFPLLVEQLNSQHREELNCDCQELIDAYADVKQLTVKPVKRGYVKTKFVQEDAELSYEELMLQNVADEIKRLLQQGVKMNDIALLVRKKRHISTLAQYLNKQEGIKVTSDEAFRLDASSSIAILIDSLRYLNNTKDEISLNSLTINYQTEVLANQQSWDEIIRSEAGAMLPAAYWNHLSELLLMPLYELIEELYNIFQLSNIKGQDAYICTFMDSVTEYLQNQPSELSAFLKHWDERLCSKTIVSCEVEGIRAYTIHKSKGLEFHTVIIPFADWRMENETNNQLVWCTSDEAPYNTLSLLPVKYSSAMASSTFRKSYLKERLQLWVDNLNVLYVALTRAEKNMIILGKKEKRARKIVSELIENALPNMASRLGAQWDEESLIFEWGELIKSKEEKTNKTVDNNQDIAKEKNRLCMQAKPIPLQIESLKHAIEFKQSNRSADFIAGMDATESPHRFIERGKLLHTLFSLIKTKEDLESAINRLTFEGIITGEMIQDTKELAEKAMNLPQVESWFNGTYKVYNECEIISKHEDKLRPDRVMINNDEIIVVDFKFGKPSKAYIAQVKKYMHALHLMGHPQESIQGYLWYVTDEKIEKINL